MRASVSGVSSVSALKIRIFVSANRKQKTRSFTIMCSGQEMFINNKLPTADIHKQCKLLPGLQWKLLRELLCSGEMIKHKPKQAAEGAGGCCCDRSRDGRVPMIPGN